jgi:hypothetical protein
MANRYLNMAGEDIGDDLGDDPTVGDDLGDDPTVGDELGARGKRKSASGARKPPEEVTTPVDSTLVGPAIPAGETKQIEVKPQRGNYPKRLVTASTKFLVLSITVGIENVFAAVGAVQSEMFSPQAVKSPAFIRRRCAASQSMFITVKNVHTAAQDFFATIVGDEIPQG